MFLHLPERHDQQIHREDPDQDHLPESQITGAVMIARHLRVAAEEPFSQTRWILGGIPSGISSSLSRTGASKIREFETDYYTGGSISTGLGTRRLRPRFTTHEDTRPLTNLRVEAL